jgi:hypothetical protein
MPESVVCPHCGESIDRKALSCRYCGSDAQTGWKDGPNEGAIDWQDEVDYETSLEEEFGDGKPLKPASGIPGWVALVAVALAVLFLIALLRNAG